MSRKSKRNRPSPPTAAAQPAAPAGRAGKTIALVIAAATLVIAAALGTLLLPGKPQASAEIASALASMQAPAFGPADARVHLVEFLDPACETCATFYPHVKRLMAENPGRIRLSLRHVAFHEGAGEAVRIVEGARAQGKYREALEALLANQAQWVVNHRVQPDRIWDAIAAAGLDPDRLRIDMAAGEVSRRMEQDMADARTLRVTQTPEYFVNGRQMSSFGLEELRSLVADEVRRAYP